MSSPHALPGCVSHDLKRTDAAVGDLQGDSRPNSPSGSEEIQAAERGLELPRVTEQAGGHRWVRKQFLPKPSSMCLLPGPLQGVKGQPARELVFQKDLVGSGGEQLGHRSG